jgi:hypothetical protein
MSQKWKSITELESCHLLTSEITSEIKKTIIDWIRIASWKWKFYWTNIERLKLFAQPTQKAFQYSNDEFGEISAQHESGKPCFDNLRKNHRIRLILWYMWRKTSANWIHESPWIQKS